MISRICWIVAGALLLLGMNDGAEACSLDRFPDVRSASSSFFVGTATADTARAGPGDATFYPSDPSISDPLNAPARPIYGQVIRLDRIGGPDADSVREFAEEFDGTVVVVPWGYRSDCRKTTWTGTARWVEPTAQGVFVAQLRDPEHWISGQPTYDAGGSHQPFPHGRALHLGDVPEDSLLTPDQFFSLYAALPERKHLEHDSERALEPLRSWIAAHPALHSRLPVSDIVASVFRAAEFARVRQIVPPMRGTYRLTVTPMAGPSGTSSSAQSPIHPVRRTASKVTTCISTAPSHPRRSRKGTPMPGSIPVTTAASGSPKNPGSPQWARRIGQPHSIGVCGAMLPERSGDHASRGSSCRAGAQRGVGAIRRHVPSRNRRSGSLRAVPAWRRGGATARRRPANLGADHPVIPA